ncbi:MAG: hypothetical protein L3K09_04020 [Thermoplasmata archaeon]|nr:hypothetical protein [Thermoplasmata archaeon]
MLASPPSNSSTSSRCSRAARRTPTTTLPSEELVTLPECSEFPDDVVSTDLTDLLDKAALIRALAEEGIEGAKGFLEESARKDPRLAQRIAELRERLRRQAARKVGRIVNEYDRRAKELETVDLSERQRIDANLKALEARLAAARKLDLSKLADMDLLSEFQDALLLPDASWMRPEAPPSIFARLRALIARLIAFLKGLFSRRKGKAKSPPAKERRLNFATISAGGRHLGASELGEAISGLSAPQREELEQTVERSIHQKERDLRKEAEEKRREMEAQRRALEAEREEAKRRAEREAVDRVKEAEDHRLTRELKERGFVAERGGELAVTYGLIERFARLVLEEETRSLPGDVRFSLKGSGSTGVYEKARLRQPEEVAHLDLPSSLLQARMEGSKHIDEATMFVYREQTSERVHVVMMFDKSGSMAESEKLTAAKKALLALYVAVRRRHPDATIDVVAFDNDVRLLDLVELWECTPGSFTNTAEALRTAHLLLRSSKASRKEVYLVTDGLPESYTDADGKVRSGNLDQAMAHALARAQELHTVTPLTFTMILLRSEHPEYETAAKAVTRALDGSLVVTDPERLGVELLIRWARGSETVRKVAKPEPNAPPLASRPRTKKRRADRRMGG